MKTAKRIIKVLLFLIILAISMLYFFQEKLIFYSSTLPREYQYTFQSDFKELFLKADDGAVLNGLHFKVDNPKGVIIYNHGNKGELDTWGHWAELLANRYSYDVVLWDYRGYGKSTGKRRQKHMLDDGLLFYNYCKEIYNEDVITVYGRSLGGFFATHMILRNSPKKLILESTPSSLEDVARGMYPILPVKWLLKFKFQNTNNIMQIKTPSYLIHGTADDLIPFEQGQFLFKNSAATVKEFYPIEGGNHNNLSDFEEAYFRALDAVLK